jgi:alkylresorcinol/alkylpyrone synthase/polyketide synthase Type III
MTAVSHPGILALGTANPRQCYTQQEIYDLLARYEPSYRNDRIRQIFMNSDIDERHVYFDIETIDPFETRDQLHERFRAGSLEIGKQAIARCLEQAGLATGDIDCIIAVSCTGYLCPGLSSLYINDCGFRTDVQRGDLLGMGCAGAMPGLQRAHDFVRAYPDRKALVVTVEICSACYYIDDSLETVVGNAICADGAAAAVIGMSSDTRVPKIRRFETLLEPSLIHTVGFEHRDGRLRIILSKDIRSTAGSLAKKLVAQLLERDGHSSEDIRHWILHSGGRKVIENLRQELSLSDDQLRHSTCVLKHFGNMSSPTVLFVLDEAQRNGGIHAGDLGVMLAMGPGLALESCILEW